MKKKNLFSELVAALVEVYTIEPIVSCIWVVVSICIAGAAASAARSIAGVASTGAHPVPVVGLVAFLATGFILLVWIPLLLISAVSNRIFIAGRFWNPFSPMDALETAYFSGDQGYLIFGALISICTATIAAVAALLVSYPSAITFAESLFTDGTLQSVNLAALQTMAYLTTFVLTFGTTFVGAAYFYCGSDLISHRLGKRAVNDGRLEFCD
jgi:hypothetical protein